MRMIWPTVLSMISLASCRWHDRVAERDLAMLSNIEQVIRAVREGDYATVAALTSDSVGAVRIAELQRLNPVLTSALSQAVRKPRGVTVRGDSAFVFYDLGGRGWRESVSVTLVRDRKEWRFSRIGLPNRI